MGSEWKTDEDFFNDLLTYSEYTEPTKSPHPEPKTITEWKNMNFKNNTPSVFDSEFAEEHDCFISGRGRGQPNRIVRPGNPIQSLPSDSEDITRRIRETGGLYFRNDLLEQRFRSKLVNDNKVYEEEFRDASDDENLASKLGDLSVSTSGISSNSSPRSGDSAVKQKSSPQSDQNSESSGNRSPALNSPKNTWWSPNGEQKERPLELKDSASL